MDADTDADGFSDGYEISVLCTSPVISTLNIDSDKDGLTNLDEMKRGTNPYLSDCDFDGQLDLADSNPFVTDFTSEKKVDYNFKLVTGEFDKTYEFKNADNKKCTLIINTLTDVVKYYEIEDTSKSFYFYNIDYDLTAQVNEMEGQFSADTYAYEDNNIPFIGH